MARPLRCYEAAANPHHGESQVAAYGCQMFAANEAGDFGPSLVTSTPSKLRQGAASGAFAKILAKLYFFQLFENLRRILLNYGQKRTRRANATFNAAC